VRPVLAPELLQDGLDPRALICNLLANQPGLPEVLEQSPPSEAVTQLARASVVCGAILGQGTGNDSPLGVSLAPIQSLLGLLNGQPSLNALTPVTLLPGTATRAPNGGTAGGSAGGPPPGGGGKPQPGGATPTQPGAGILGFENTGGGQ
jgi:hypothetical protein